MSQLSGCIIWVLVFEREFRVVELEERIDGVIFGGVGRECRSSFACVENWVNFWEVSGVDVNGLNCLGHFFGVYFP